MSRVVPPASDASERVPIAELWIDGGGHTPDRLVWCSVNFRLSTSSPARSEPLSSDERWELVTLVQDVLTHFGGSRALNSLDSPDLPAAEEAVKRRVAERFAGEGRTVERVLFQRICTVDDHQNTWRRWLQYMLQTMRIANDASLAGQAMDEQANLLMAEMISSRMVALPRGMSATAFLKSFLRADGKLPYESDPEKQCPVCDLPLRVEHRPGPCSVCGRLSHPWHLVDQVCGECAKTLRKRRYRAWVAGFIGVACLGAAYLLARALPPALPLIGNSYYLFHGGYANGWLPQYFMVDPETRAAWGPEDYKRAMTFSIATEQGGPSEERFLRLVLRPGETRQGWLGLGWTLRPYDKLTEKINASVTLSGAQTLEFDAATDEDALRVQFKAVVARDDPDMMGDSARDEMSLPGNPVLVTPEWQHFAISVDGRDLSRTVTGFCTILAKDDQIGPIDGPQVVKLKNIRWVFPNGQRSRFIKRTLSIGLYAAGGLLLLAVLINPLLRASRRAEPPAI